MFKAKQIFQLAAVTITSAGLSACAMDTADSDKVASTKDASGQVNNNIDRRYSITYSESEARNSFVGTFTMSGTWFTTIKLQPPANLTVDGRAVSDSQLLSQGGAVTAGLLLPALSPFFFLASGTHYYANLDSGRGLIHSITFTDQNGKVFSDQMQMYTASLSAPTSLSRTADYVATMSGSPAAGETSYAVRIEQRDMNGRLVLVSGSTSYGSQIRISATELAKLSAGPATIYGERRVRVKLNSQGSGSATGTSVYQTRSVNITVY